MKKIILLVLVVISTAWTFAVPRIIYVTPGGSSLESVDGLTWGNAVSLSRARALANFYNTKTVPEENQIWMKVGVYDLTSSFQTNMKITIYGGFSGNETLLSERNWAVNQTILNQTGAAMVIWGNTEDDVLLDGLILQGGRPVGGNGCGQIAQGTTLKNCIIRNNKATGSTGALGFNAVSGSVKKVTLENCLIINNESATSPGAIAAGAVPADLINCTVAYNLNATTGATGTITTTGAFNMYNCVIYNNKNGANIAKAVGNSAAKTLRYNAWDVAASDGTLSNNIILTSSPFVSATSYVGAANGTSQLVSAIESANFKLISGTSPTCINTGNDTYTTATTDLSGVIRKNGTVDMGCYEYGMPDAPTAITVTAGNAKAIVGFTAPTSNGGSAILDYTVTSVPGGITATGSSSPIIITGLTNGTAYGFTVKARNVNGSGEISAQSSQVTPHATNNNISVASNGNISAQTITPISDVVVDNGAELNINSSTTINSLTIAPEAKVSVGSNTLTAAGGVILQSNASATATLVDNYASPTITATVQQYLPQGRNWYVASPIETNIANTANLTTGAATSVSYYSEQNGWQNNYSGNLTAGVGYVAVSAAGTGTNNVSFNGKLNSGDVTVTLTRKALGSTAGFNLIANPYPSYMNPMPAINANSNLVGTIWYRSRKTVSPYEYKFETVNTTSGVGTNNAGTGTVTGYIPPMQAFWVRTNADNQTLTFTNAMRDHARDVTVGAGTVPTTPLKMKKQETHSLLRLKITGNAGSDEAILYFNADALNGFDKYDSPKMFESATTLTPEIFTLVGTEKLVINGRNTVQYETELPLGFVAKQAGDYTISRPEMTNFDAGTRILLIDKFYPATEFELSEGTVYNFSTQVTTPTTDRFSLIFRAPGTTTNLKNTEKLNVQVFVNAQNRIVISALSTCNYSIYNAIGQKVTDGMPGSNCTVINTINTPGIYVIKVSEGAKQYTSRVIIN